MTLSLARRIARAATFAATLVASLAAAPVLAQNLTTGGVEVRAFLARATTNVYAAAYGGGLYRSTDTAANWVRLPMPGNERYLTSIDGNASGVVIVGAEEGLLRSTDGTNFTRTLTEPISAVAVPPAPSNALWVLVGIRGVGILRSLDGGVSFTLVDNSAFDSLDITAIAFSPANSNTVYAAAKPDGQGNRGGVFRSLDAGQTWAAYNTGIAAGDKYVTSLAVDSVGTAYAGVLRPSDNSGPAYFRTSAGANWAPIANTFGVVSLHRDANTGTTIWLGNRLHGVMTGNSAGFNYNFPGGGALTPNLLYTSVNAVVTLPSGSPVVAMGLRGAGVWRSSAVASPRNWTRTPFTGADRVLSASNRGNSGNSMVAGLYAGGVWRSDTDGASFFPPTESAGIADFSFAPTVTGVVPFVSIWDLAASPTNANLIYAAAGGVGMFYMNDGAGLFRWNGTQWGAVGSNAPVGAPWGGNVETGIALGEQIYGISLNRSNDAVAYAGKFTPGGGAFVRSGTNWTTALIPGITPQIRTIVTSAANPNKLLALPFDDKAILSGDGGANWAQVTMSQLGFERIRFFAAAENPTNTNQWIAASSRGIFTSINGATSFERIAMGGVFQQLVITAVGFNAAGKAFAADWDGNRYCSPNGGATWVSAGTKLTAGVNAIRMVNGFLYYLTDGAGMIRENGTC